MTLVTQHMAIMLIRRAQMALMMSLVLLMLLLSLSVPSPSLTPLIPTVDLTSQT